jgi:hypothetical protein
MDILSAPLSTGSKQVSKSAFALLFAEVFHHCQQRASDAGELEERLKELGHSVGWRMLNLIVARERPRRRETNVVGMLQLVTGTCWKALFGRDTNSLQRSTANESEYFIYENDPLPNAFISVPRELQGRLNCASFNAGIIRGLLAAGGFPASVRAVVPASDGKAGSRNTTTVYVVRFESHVLQREQARK